MGEIRRSRERRRGTVFDRINRVQSGIGGQGTKAQPRTTPNTRTSQIPRLTGITLLPKKFSAHDMPVKESSSENENLFVADRRMMVENVDAVTDRRRPMQLKMQKVKFKIEGERPTGGFVVNCAKGSAVTDRRYSPDAKPSEPGLTRDQAARFCPVVPDRSALSRVVPHPIFFGTSVSREGRKERKVREVRDSSPRLLRFIRVPAPLSCGRGAGIRRRAWFEGQNPAGTTR
jgi:hypothetical protein